MKRSAMSGAIVWAVLVGISRISLMRLNTIESLFVLAPLVVVPLGLQLCDRFSHNGETGRDFKWMLLLQPPAALCAAASFFMHPGIGASILALPWLGFGCFLGVIGLRDILHGSSKRLESMCVAASFLYLPIGCAWLIASRLGMTPMGFQEPIVLLTAVHFHFAGFAAPLLAVAAGSAIPMERVTLRRTFNVVAAGVLGGPGLLAAGFVIGPRVKLAAALVVGCSEIGLSLFFLACIRRLRPRIAQVSVAISAVSVLFAMILAGAWAIGEFPLQPFVHLDEMAKFHGIANSFGFTLCGLVGWLLVSPNNPRQKRDDVL